MFQVFIAVTDAWSTGPKSHWPLPCTHAYSPLERLTPSSRCGCPPAVTIRLPDTRSFGAGPPGSGLVLGLGVGLVRVGLGVITEPVQGTLLIEKFGGTGLAARHEPTNPMVVEAPVL